MRDAFPDIVIEQASNFTELLAKLEGEHFDLLLLDIDLPDGRELRMIEAVRKRQPEIKILIFSAYSEERYALSYIHAGADGYLNKFSSDSQLTGAVKSVMTTKKYISPFVKEKILEEALNKNKKKQGNPLEMLSDRELEIARLLVRGDSNTEISGMLYLHASTVSTYKNRIFEKLGIKNIVSLAELIRLHG